MEITLRQEMPVIQWSNLPYMDTNSNVMNRISEYRIKLKLHAYIKET